MTVLSWLTAGILLAAVAFVAYVLMRYIPIIERNAFEVPRIQPPSDYAMPEDLKIRKLQIPYDTRRAIEAMYIKARHRSKKLVVFCHETGADLTSWYKHAYFLPEHGVDVLTFNFQPVALAPKAESDTIYPYQWPSRKDLHCLERVLSWVAVEKKGFEVALFGVSKGATVAAAAAPSPLIKSVMLDGAFSTRMTLQRYMKKWVNIYVSTKRLSVGIPDWVYIALAYTTLMYASLKKNIRFFSIEKFIARLKKPVFWIHAGKDSHILTDHVEALRHMIPGQTELWVAEGAGHANAVTLYPGEYSQKIVSFIDKTLKV